MFKELLLNEAKVNLKDEKAVKFSLKLNASIIRFEEYYNGSKNYFSGSIGVGYIFH